MEEFGFQETAEETRVLYSFLSRNVLRKQGTHTKKRLLISVTIDLKWPYARCSHLLNIKNACTNRILKWEITHGTFIQNIPTSWIPLREQQAVYLWLEEQTNGIPCLSSEIGFHVLHARIRSAVMSVISPSMVWSSVAGQSPRSLYAHVLFFLTGFDVSICLK